LRLSESKINTPNRLLLYTLILIMGIYSFVFPQTVQSNIVSYLPNPNELGMWQLVDSARIFAENNLFDLIDGGADMYLEYGFRQVLSAEYRNKDEHSIKAEIYEMKDASAAYGMFSLNAGTQGKKIRVGNEGLLNEYYLMFWKERFLVFLSAEDTLHESLAGIHLIAAKIDQKLGLPGQKPALVHDLPAKNLQICKYFRGILGLSSLYTFDYRNIFEITEGVEGTYSTCRAYLFSYKSEQESREKYLKALEVMKASSRFSHVQTLDGRCTMIDQKNNHLCITPFKNRIVITIAAGKENALIACDEVIASLENH
jgi:hypothetical protein